MYRYFLPIWPGHRIFAFLLFLYWNAFQLSLTLISQAVSISSQSHRLPHIFFYCLFLAILLYWYFCLYFDCTCLVFESSCLKSKRYHVNHPNLEYILYLSSQPSNPYGWQISTCSQKSHDHSWIPDFSFCWWCVPLSCSSQYW